MTPSIHPLAVVDPTSRLGDGVRVGPFAVIGAGVEIGDGTEIGAGAQVHGPARIGRENRIYPHAAIGFDPQDLKFQGEEVWLEIGDRNVFREFCTVHRGTAKGGGVTRVGSDSLFMAYTHIGHDCQVGSRIVFANNATLAGHVEVHDDANVSAFSSVHQFCRVGRHAYVGGYTVATMDVLPFVKTVGQKPACYGLNSVGLKRKGFDNDRVRRLELAYRILVRSKLNTPQALERLTAELAGDPDVDYLIAFVESSQRGIHKSTPRGGGRGGGGGGEPE
ncbi:MAG TPA: acyl-ACP--UDP-N-acetylglucosamine O-acyltransferase [Thermoanaerobaculia bacterium]|nr:acyl-ACP--UDP-N-acetylglucosamine O-acyltransferase [Thermoanaerobaculia bacterium]